MRKILLHVLNKLLKRVFAPDTLFFDIRGANSDTISKRQLTEGEIDQSFALQMQRKPTQDPVKARSRIENKGMQMEEHFVGAEIFDGGYMLKNVPSKKPNGDVIPNQWQKVPIETQQAIDAFSKVIDNVSATKEKVAR